jgi:hypothetical protein
LRRPKLSAIKGSSALEEEEEEEEEAIFTYVNTCESKIMNSGTVART